MEQDVFEIVAIDSLVPRDHLLRKIDQAVDFNRLYEMVGPLYCEDNGRPSIDPVVLFKMVLIQHLYGLPSLQRTAEEVSLNVERWWFCDILYRKRCRIFQRRAIISGTGLPRRR